MESKKCQHCGADVLLCRLNCLDYAGNKFSFVCPWCERETKITYQPREEVSPC